MGHPLSKIVLGMFTAFSMNSLLAVDKLASAQNDVIFGANVTNNSACVIFVRQDGTFGTNGTGTQLSSLLTGGQSGIADVFALFPYQISVTPPPFFTSGPPGADTGVSYSTFFAGQALNAGGVNFPTQPGTTPVQLTNFFGFTRLTVDLVADRPDPFPAGNYSTYATVRCE